MRSIANCPLLGLASQPEMPPLDVKSISYHLLVDNKLMRAFTWKHSWADLHGHAMDISRRKFLGSFTLPRPWKGRQENHRGLNAVGTAAIAESPGANNVDAQA